MRDPKRIPKILKRLEKIWLQHPDLRLGQIFCIVKSISFTDIFYVEDEILIDKIEFLLKQVKEYEIAKMSKLR